MSLREELEACSTQSTLLCAYCGSRITRGFETIDGSPLHRGVYKGPLSLENLPSKEDLRALPEEERPCSAIVHYLNRVYFTQ